MIPRPDENILLLVTHPGGARSFDYGDYWEGEELIYTGRGLRGDQARTGPNRVVGENSAKLLVFEATGESRQLVFRGPARCIDEWTTTAPDRDERVRRILRFRLRFDQAPAIRRRDAGSEVNVPARLPRPFDPSRTLGVSHPKGWRRSPEEILALQEKARQGHHELLAALATWLGEHNWQNVEEIEGAVDLWATRPSGAGRVIFEAKTVRPKAESRRVRAAVAQLLEYRYFYGAVTDALSVVTDRPLSDVRCRLLDSLGIAVIWRDRERFSAGSRTAAEVLEGPVTVSD